jgi:Na+-transporting NADH:ubiquinone oxidoreductase subunit NqrB
MATTAAAPAGRPTLTLRGTAYPVLLPKLSDPRLHLAAVIISLQVLGQTAFDFDLSIAQILIALATCAVLEVAIAFRQQHVIMWPASALLTGNGVAFVLRVPGTQHGDWWSTNGWWIFAGTAAISLLSKYVIRWRGNHIFNPSNFGLVLCFLVLGSDRAEPLAFWWGPMSFWMAVALAIIVLGGLAILLRLDLLGIAIGFWVAFAASIAVVAATGHAMTARYHLGPITSRYFWWILVTSPEVLVFMFFMITDPKTTPKGRVARVAYGVGVGLLATLLIAPMETEFQAKVALLGSLTIVCAVRPLLEWLLPAAGSPDDRFGEWVKRAASRGRTGVAKLGGLGLAAAAAFAGVLVLAGIPARPGTAVAAPLTNSGILPQITILHSSGVSSQLDRPTAREVASSLVHDLKSQAEALRARDQKRANPSLCCQALGHVEEQIKQAAGTVITVPTYRLEQLRMKLRPAEGQGEPIVVVDATGAVQESVYGGTPQRLVLRSKPRPFAGTFQMDRGSVGYEVISFSGAKVPGPKAVASAGSLLVAKSFDGVRLQDVADQVGLRFQQDSFRYGVAPDVHSMMGGGLCWLDYNNDGKLDLFVVNSYSDADATTWEAHGGLPRSTLFENEGGHFVDVGARTHADPAVQGNGCVAADLNGDGYTDLFITTNTYNVLLWNNGDGTFTDGTKAAGIDVFGTYGWHTGAAVADVNGDGRPDIFVSGYANVNGTTSSTAGFPSNYQAYPDLLYLNEGPDAHGHSGFRDVAAKVGIDRAGKDHGLGAVFTDVNGDGRPDLYVANDLDPNRLYLNVPGGPLGFHFVEEGRQWRVADRNAGMGVAAQDWSGDGRPDLLATNSRDQGHSASRSTADGTYRNVDALIARAIGRAGTGWGDSWIDLENDGRLDLVLANGAIPVTNLKKDAGPVQVLENTGGRFADATAALGLKSGPLVNGRGVAAADYDNDGRMDVAVNSIGGKLILLHNTGDSGHWLEVSLSRFAPGAVVTAVLPSGRRLVDEIQAGSSYLSSEDPRAHFGLGDATKVRALAVRWPSGRVTRLHDVGADRIVTVRP